jgi:quercetin dioxygenase-like cupin family protein
MLRVTARRRAVSLHTYYRYVQAGIAFGRSSGQPMGADLVEDPVLRQRYRLSREGDILRNELWADPGAAVPEHFHPRLEERFEVLDGEFEFQVGKERRRAGPGDRLVVPAGAHHSFENAGSGVAHFVAEIEPALDMEDFFEESAALARAGKYTQRGLPKGLGALLEVVEFAERYRETTVLAFPPPAVQRILFPPLARLARRRRSRAGR